MFAGQKLLPCACCQIRNQWHQILSSSANNYQLGLLSNNRTKIIQFQMLITVYLKIKPNQIRYNKRDNTSKGKKKRHIGGSWKSQILLEIIHLNHISTLTSVSPPFCALVYERRTLVFNHL